MKRKLFFLFGLFCLVAATNFFVGNVLAAERLETNGQMFPNDPQWQKQWYLRQIHMSEAWEVTTGTHDVIVAVIDGGVDIHHPDLQDNIWRNEREIPDDHVDNDGNGYVDDVNGWNYVTNSSDVRPMAQAGQHMEAWSHGTMVSSLIAAKGNNGIGIAGVAWNVRLMPLVVLDGEGSGKINHIVQAMRYAVNHGAKVINMSFVGFETDDVLNVMMQKAANAGVVLVAATGNDHSRKEGMNLDVNPLYPVCINIVDNVTIGVTGTDTLDQHASNANYGKDCTDLAAPGHEMVALSPTYHMEGTTLIPAAQEIDRVSGTSLAAPLVSGAAALIRSLRPEWSAQQIREHLYQTSDVIEVGIEPHRRGLLGYGRLNTGRAVQSLVQSSSTQVSSTTLPLPPESPTTVLQSPILLQQEEELSEEIISLRLSITHERNATEFHRLSSGEERIWRIEGNMEQRGWADLDQNGEQEAYALVRAGEGFEWYVWQPNDAAVQGVKIPLSGNGSWYAWPSFATGTRPFILFSSPQSKFVTLWDPVRFTAQQIELFTAMNKGVFVFAHASSSSWSLFSTSGKLRVRSLNAKGEFGKEETPLRKFSSTAWRYERQRSSSHLRVRGARGTMVTLSLQKHGNWEKI